MGTQSSDQATTVRLKSGWWYASDGDRKGPISTDELCDLLISGTLTPKSLIWRQGMEGWQQVRQVNALAPLLAALPPELPSELAQEPAVKAGSAAPEPRPEVQTSAEPSARAYDSMPVPQA